jgi:hypothetical protein
MDFQKFWKIQDSGCEPASAHEGRFAKNELTHAILLFLGGKGYLSVGAAPGRVGAFQAWQVTQHADGGKYAARQIPGGMEWIIVRRGLPGSWPN